MENSSRSWDSSESLTLLDNDTRSSILDDLLNNIAELMNFEASAGWCGSPVLEESYASYGMSSLQSMPYSGVYNFSDQNIATNSVNDGRSTPDVDGSSFRSGDTVAFQPMDSEFGCSLNSTEDDNSNASRSNGLVSEIGSDANRSNHYFQQDVGSGMEKCSEIENCMISRLLGCQLAEKMLAALSFFKHSFEGGILAQVWVPIKTGDHYVLSTYEQPYLLDQTLAGYREVSRAFVFPVENKAGYLPGLPGRVFMSRVPEWTSNVGYYNVEEYLRVKHAAQHDVHGSIALPIFEPSETSCCAVLEIVTSEEKSNFDPEIELVCQALQAVNLKSTIRPQLQQQYFSKNQRAALAEIADVLRAVCHAHQLPLALTWIPCNFTGGDAGEIVRGSIRQSDTSSAGKCMLCIEETACYVNDTKMQGFVHACMEHHIEEGQGVSGKTLQSNQPFFFGDVKKYDISEYPLVHHARKFGLNAAVAIKLRSILTGNDDYILEFFLPVGMKGSAEQQLLLNNLSGTMQRMCRTLSRVSDTQSAGTESSELEVQREPLIELVPSIPASESNSQVELLESEFNSDRMALEASNIGSEEVAASGPLEEKTSGSRKHPDKRRTLTEKNVTLGVLQQHFSGSLKDAAKSIGVCPTTLKRICRQHGISRWPSRKINKVNRSLKKIQTALSSVQGVEGGLKFDPATGGLVAAGSVIKDFSAGPNIPCPRKLVPRTSAAECDVKLEEDDSYMVGDKGSPRTLQQNTSTKPNTNPSTPILSSLFAHGGGSWGGRSSKTTIPTPAATTATTATAANEMDTGVDSDQAVSSGMTASSNNSASMVHAGSSGSPIFEHEMMVREKTTVGSDTVLKITIKATYKEDTIRFKFEPSAGCFQLYEEVARRFRLQTGTFQLKYLDDEEEWVMLVNDADLQECLEILGDTGSKNVKFLVRDTPTAIGSSGSSSCFMTSSSAGGWKQSQEKISEISSPNPQQPRKRKRILVGHAVSFLPSQFRQMAGRPPHPTYQRACRI